MESNKSNNRKYPSERPDHPFAKLRGSDIRGNNSVFYNVPDRSDIVVRKSFVNVHGEGSEEMTIHERAEYLKHQADEFRKIIERYGIKMAKTDYVIGTDPEKDRPAIFGVTERINGENLDKMSVLDKEMIDKVDELYTKIIAGLIDSYLEDGYSWYDPNNTQFVFGKAEGDEKPDIYLVDVDPHIFKWDNLELQKIMKVEGKEGLFWKKMSWVRMNMDDMERKVGEKGFKFAKAREMLEKAKVEIPNI